MRVRLQLLLPLAVGLLVAGGFIVSAASVGDAVRDALLTVPGLTRERAVRDAVAAVTLAGIVVTTLTVALSALVARLVVRPLRRMQTAVEAGAPAHSTDGSGPAPQAATTAIAEIQDALRGTQRVVAELRDRLADERSKRSELNRLLESVSEGILQTDGDGRIERVNPAGRKLLGLPRDVLGERVSSLLRDESLRRAVEHAAAGEPTPPLEVLLDERRVLAAVAPQRGGGAVATLVDLTDLRRLEEVRRDFVANASHELKTPLTSIRGYADTLLADDIPDTERRQFLETISRNANRLQRIVDDLLDLSRIEAGRWQPELKSVSIGDTARAVWAAFAGRAADRGVAFEIELPEDDRVLADAQALEQIFTNLFDNALRYTPDQAPGRSTERAGRIRVTSHLEPGRPPGPGEPSDSLEAAGGWLIVEVSDTGAGIPRDSLPRIFERFYRTDPARSRAEGGTGLGLSIVKHMVESMGGAISAESVLGRGTTLRLRLKRPPA